MATKIGFWRKILETVVAANLESVAYNKAQSIRIRTVLYAAFLNLASNEVILLREIYLLAAEIDDRKYNRILKKKLSKINDT